MDWPGLVKFGRHVARRWILKWWEKGVFDFEIVGKRGRERPNKT